MRGMKANSPNFILLFCCMLKNAVPRVLRAAAFAPAALSLLAPRLLRKTAALITHPKSVWS
jgi:hypothetical protein